MTEYQKVVFIARMPKWKAEKHVCVCVCAFACATMHKYVCIELHHWSLAF